MKQRIALLGSTGSIGVQTLDIVRENSELFEITTLTAHRNWEALARQAEEFAPDSVVIADDSKYDALRRALADRPVKVYAGADAIRQVVQADTVDTVVNALAINSGMLCDGAKASCAAKIASAVEAGLLGMQMYRHDRQFYGGDGIVVKGVENTIRAVSCIARDGMRETDNEIIRLMIGEEPVK